MDRKMTNMAENALADLIGQSYGVKLVQFKADLGGWSAVNREVELDGSPHVLKLHSGKSPDEITTLETLVHYLHDRGIPAVPPRKNRDGTGYFRVEDQIGTLTPKVGGLVLHEPDLNARPLKSVAQLLAKFHQLGRTATFPLRTAPDLSQPETQEKAAELIFARLSTSEIATDIRRITEDSVKNKLKNATRLRHAYAWTLTRRDQDLVHGDFHNENLLFREDHSVAYLFDFDEIHYGQRTEDIMNFIHLGCCQTGYSEPNLKKSEIFLQAYRRYHGVTADEITYGFRHSVLKMASSLFLENRLLDTGADAFRRAILRDQEKLAFLQTHLEELIKYLRP
jgi:Ser/Thr protein kinase RdoA (MazF antagonist)